MISLFCLLASSCAGLPPLPTLDSLLEQEVVFKGKTYKQFERKLLTPLFGKQVQEMVTWNLRVKGAREKAFLELYNQLPAPCDKEAVRQWLMQSVTPGMTAEEARVFLLLHGFNSAIDLVDGRRLNPLRFNGYVAVHVEKAHFWETDTQTFHCSVRVLIDNEEKVTDVIVDRAEKVVPICFGG
jgi:hypothetical protein